MPKYIASYDLEDMSPSPYGPFLGAAEDNGWLVWIRGEEKWCRLPNTTLIGDFDTLDDAVNAFKKAKREAEQMIGARITMPKWIVSERQHSRFASDERVD